MTFSDIYHKQVHLLTCEELLRKLEKVIAS